eukprot:6257513-Amphidinium_carterae.1
MGDICTSALENAIFTKTDKATPRLARMTVEPYLRIQRRGLELFIVLQPNLLHTLLGFWGFDSTFCLPLARSLVDIRPQGVCPSQRMAH